MNKTNIYFHGSSEPKMSKLDAPSYEHPFYVTTDLHYAMAFCTKTQSSTGEYASKKLNFTPSSQNYVYVVSLKPNIKLLDFRDHSSKQFKNIMSKLISSQLMEYIESTSKNLDMSDIYEFCIALDELFTQIGDSSYVKYMNSNDGKDVLSAKLFLQAKSLMKRLGWDSTKDMHSIMAPILKHLHSKGYQGIVTREHDTNNDLQPGNNRVDTSCAIGIFDIAGLDTIGLVPMRYNWLKKINPNYLQNATSEDARQKIKRFIQLYKQIAMKNANINESQIDASRVWYFGNNRSKNLRIVKPAWYRPFFLTTSYEYGELVTP